MASSDARLVDDSPYVVVELDFAALEQAEQLLAPQGQSMEFAARRSGLGRGTTDADCGICWLRSAWAG